MPEVTEKTAATVGNGLAVDEASAGVVSACTALQKAFRSWLLYPHGNKITRATDESLYQALLAALDEHGTIDLQVEDSCLLHEGLLVYQAPALGGNLAFALFREGIRALRLHASLRREEVRGLLRCLTRAESLSRDDEDIVTLMWEEDFTHIDYEVANPLLVEDGRTGEASERIASSLTVLRRDTEDQLEAAAKADWGRGSPITLGGIGENEGSKDHPQVLVGSLLDAGDAEYLEALMRCGPDLLKSFSFVLGQLLETAGSEEELALVLDTMHALMETCLRDGLISHAGHLAKRLASRATSAPATRPRIATLMEKTTGSPELAALLRQAEEGAPEDRESLVGLLLTLRPYCQERLLDLLSLAEGKMSRAVLLRALTAEGGVPAGLVIAKLMDSRWYVVRNMVYLLGRLKDPSAVPYLKAPLSHTDERVRREAVRAIASLAGTDAASLLIPCLDDESRTVRMAAAFALARFPGKKVAAALAAHLFGGDAGGKSEAEIEAFAVALASTGDDSLIPLLERTWQSRFPMRRPLILRLAALRVLAGLGTSAARASLERAADKGASVAQFASKCLSSPPAGNWAGTHAS